MKAVVYNEYGGPHVLRVVEIDQPAPRADEVLLHVRAASLNPRDWHMMRGSPRLLRVMSGLRAPKDAVKSADVGGTVEAVGSEVTSLRPGDEVFGIARGFCAEFATASPGRLALKPGNATFAEAAALPVAGLTALQALRDRGQVRAGQSVLINGAAGGVGTFAVQIGHALGATMTGVCSTRNIELVRSLGAAQVIDYTERSYVGEERRYDLVIDTVGNHSLTSHRRCLKEGGRYVGVGGSADGSIGILLGLLHGPLLSAFGTQKFGAMLARGNAADLATLAEMVATGKVRAVIDRSYPLERIAEAHAYVDTGRKRGNVAVTLP